MKQQEMLARMQKLRKKVASGAFKKQKSKPVSPVAKPRYDDIYQAGVTWLNDN